MGEYVDIATGVSDLIRAANHIADLGSGLDSDMHGMIADIARHEGTATWGNDSYAGKFLDHGEGGYQHPGDDGMPANRALKELGRSLDTTKPSLGSVATQFGRSVANAMMTYVGTDDNGAADIGSVNV